MYVSFQEYGLCEEWGCLYPIPREHLISLHQKHLLHLLERGDHEKALQVSLHLLKFFFWDKTKRLVKPDGFVHEKYHAKHLQSQVCPFMSFRSPSWPQDDCSHLQQEVRRPDFHARCSAGSRILLKSGQSHHLWSFRDGERKSAEKGD